MKQETIEEVAERIYTTELVMDVDISEDLQLAFINGAKWQQENSYSEYDMKEAFNGFKSGKSFNEWFEQFKKK